MRKSGFAVMMVVSLCGLALAADPTGDWHVADKTAVIQIASCGDALCGTIASTLTPGIDEHNPDPSLRNRSIVGVQILLGMKPDDQGRWKGEIYNPENGRTYLGFISLTSDNVLRIDGCVLGGLLCGGENWTRAR